MMPTKASRARQPIKSGPSSKNSMAGEHPLPGTTLPNYRGIWGFERGRRPTSGTASTTRRSKERFIDATGLPTSSPGSGRAREIAFEASRRKRRSSSLRLDWMNELGKPICRCPSRKKPRTGAGLQSLIKAVSGRGLQRPRSHALALQTLVELGAVDIDPATDLQHRGLQSIRLRMGDPPAQRGFRDERRFRRCLPHGRQVPIVNHRLPDGLMHA